MQISQKDRKQFQKEILEWYALHKRDLPWRKTRDPYSILVSEVMLQQTQVTRVISKYEAWMKRFPTVSDLSRAKTAEILAYWSGLGYNRRALYLQKCAKAVVETYHGKFPQDVVQLRQLPGIGAYTAAAVACFAFDTQLAVIDTNVRKVILTKFGIKDYTAGKGDKEIQHIADQLLPQGKAYEWNQALMDYAAGMLKKEKIPVAKQSSFKGSDRYFRGQIIKQLLKKQEMTSVQMHAFFTDEGIAIERLRLEKIVTGLVKNELLQKNGEIYKLP